MAHDVFLSYSSRDKPTADAVCASLEHCGIRCWIAPRDILPGREWGEAIVEGIRSSRVFVLIFSSHANASRQVLREVDRAVHFELPVIPFRIEQIVPTDAMEFYLSVPHWLDAWSPPMQAHIDQLSKTVSALINVESPQSNNAANITISTASDRRPEYRPDVSQQAVTRQDESLGGLAGGARQPGLIDSWWRRMGIWRRRRRLERRARSRTCPYCGSVDSLEVDSKDPTLLRCQAEVDHHGTRCAYCILKRLNSLPKIEVTVCGLRNSGKTTWISQLLTSLVRGAAWDFLELSDADSERQRDLLKVHQELLRPLTGTDTKTVWEVSEAKPVYLEASIPPGKPGWQCLVMLIDFAGGEMVSNLADSYRRRAMSADAFVVFLDVHEQPDVQLAALMGLAEDRRADLRESDVPVAICVSKLDLLDQSSPLLRELRATDSEPLTMRTLQQRHELCAQHLPRTCGLDVRQHAARLFGSRHMIFPMAPRGFSSEDDRQQHAFGVCEPIAWLLHESKVLSLPS